MKRINNIYEQVISIDNILLADRIARRGKAKQTGVIEFDKNYDQNIADLYKELAGNTYKTSPYRYRVIQERKERQIAILPYRDRIVHHAVMNVLEPVFVSMFTADTYSCIKGRGVHKASYALRDALKNVNDTTYCLQLDIRKFYPSVDNDILKSLLRKKIKDKEMLSFLDGIIDSSEGLPIGNYLSQYLSNFYLTYMDHHIKEVLGIRYYFRYADDMIILHADKSYLHYVHQEISSYLSSRLKLSLKPNRGPFPVSLGIDFGGYEHYHTHTLLRKSIKKAFVRAIKAKKSKASIASYLGWAKHCNSKNLIKKLLNEKL